MRKESSKCICLSVILLNSGYRKDDKYYPQVFLKECKYVVNKKKSKKKIKKFLPTT